MPRLGDEEDADQHQARSSPATARVATRRKRRGFLWRSSAQPPKPPRLGVAVDQRRDRVHQQDRVHDALGQTAPQADQHDQQADAETEDPGAARRDRRGHRVGDHEDRAEQQPAGAEHEQGPRGRPRG